MNYKTENISVTEVDESSLILFSKFKAIFKISHQTASNWEKRGKLFTRNISLNGYNFKYVEMEHLAGIPSVYRNRIKQYYTITRQTDFYYNTIEKCFKQ